MPALRVESRVTGVSGLREMFQQVDSDVRHKVRSKLIDLGNQAAVIARANAPVGETGQLRGSIKTILREKGARVAVQVLVDQPKDPYGYYIEFGTVDHGTKNNKTGRGGKKKRKAAREALMAAGKWRMVAKPWFGYARRDVGPRVPGALNDAVAAGVREANR